MYDVIVIKIILESPHSVRNCCKATSYRSAAKRKSFTMNLCKPPYPLLLTGPKLEEIQRATPLVFGGHRKRQ